MTLDASPTLHSTFQIVDYLTFYFKFDVQSLHSIHQIKLVDWDQDPRSMTLKNLYSRFFSKRKAQTVQQGLVERRWIRDIQAGLFVQELIEYINLWHRLPDIYLEADQVDSFGLVWKMEDSSGWKRIEGDFGKF
jgi:hypothetical protein